MFLLGLIIGAILGGTTTLILYACILAGKDKEQ